MKEISLPCLAKKELARKRIAEIMENEEIDFEMKDELTQAVQNYIAASLHFDVYGMRHILAQEAIEKFSLDINVARV